MFRVTIFVCFITLLVHISALPKLRDTNEQDSSVDDIKPPTGNLDAYLDKQEKEDFYKNYNKKSEVPVYGHGLGGNLDAYLDKQEKEDFYKNYNKKSEVPVYGHGLRGNLDAYLDKQEKENFYKNYNKKSEVPVISISGPQDISTIDAYSAKEEKDYRNSKSMNIQVGDGRNNWYGSKGVHNLTIGYKTYQDRLLYSANIIKSSKFARVVVENVVVTSAHGERISFIEAYDVHSNQGDAGYASLIGGGVGTKSATIHLKSARNHGLKYHVRVFGHF